MKNIKINSISLIITALLTLILSGCVITFPKIETSQPEIPSSSITVSPINPNWKPPSVNKGTTVLPSFADVIEKAYPSVVAINTETITLDIFSQPFTQQGAGSGWVLDNSGNTCYIVTNNHVVEGAKKITITTYDNKIYEAKPSDIRRDSTADIAVIEINNANITSLPIGDSSKLRVGDFVIALGNPLGQGLRAKEGTVSGLKVSLPVDQGQYLYDLIETSAAINPGNSGGPLINLDGEVIGITSAKIAATGVEGMGYAISIKAALPIIQQLIQRGYVIRPYLGISVITNNQYIAAMNNLPIVKGVIIRYIDPAGPASKAGLKKLDIITHFKGKEVNTAEELVQSIHMSQIGEEVQITYVRGKETKTTTARLVESPPPK